MSAADPPSRTGNISAPARPKIAVAAAARSAGFLIAAMASAISNICSLAGSDPICSMLMPMRSKASLASPVPASPSPIPFCIFWSAVAILSAPTPPSFAACWKAIISCAAIPRLRAFFAASSNLSNASPTFMATAATAAIATAAAAAIGTILDIPPEAPPTDLPNPLAFFPALSRFRLKLPV